MAEKCKVAPGPKSYIPLYTLFQYRRDRLDFFLRLMKEYGDIVCLTVGGKNIFLVTYPPYVKRILETNASNYKPSSSYEELEELIGKGLVTTDGEIWKRHRRIAQPAFRKSNLFSFIPSSVESIRETLNGWGYSPDRCNVVDINREMRCLMMNITRKSLFGSDMPLDIASFNYAFDTAHTYIMHRIESKFPLVRSMLFERSFRRCKLTLESAISGIIAECKGRNSASNNLISSLAGTVDSETEQYLTDAELLDEALTIFLASYETTASSLTWLFYLLSQNPAAREKVEWEVAENLRGNLPTPDSVFRLPYVLMVIKESLRLFPPVWAFSRQAIEDDELGPYHIPKGSKIAISPYCMHRRTDYWDSPESFCPERFGSEHYGARRAGAFCPFGAGPRQCLGQNFAMIIMQLVLMMVVQKYRLDPVKGYKLRMKAGIFIKPLGGMPMTIERIAS
jgi:cytochrome P450